MCGIAGVVLSAPGGGVLTPDLLRAMGDAMAHRGPDGDGVWLAADGRVGLAHRRLAIIDLTEAAAQPMADADAPMWIVFNGEIYNHREIRKELTALGHGHWRTDHSDTETLLRAYAQWGADCLKRLRGMFAFAIWDGARRELFLARDRLGIKPLYYARRGDRFAFASEIKALLCDARMPREVDEDALFHYLSFLCAPAPRTMFRGIHKLEAASWLKVGADGRCEGGRYWDPLSAPGRVSRSSDADALARELIIRLEDAVKAHAESDVPVGVFLSGGIDSSTNAALFARACTAPVRTFSVGYAGRNDSYPNELAYARQVAEHVGAEHHEVVLTDDDFLDLLPRMVHLQDEPIGDPVCMPVYYVSRLARQHGVKVCQVGEGADELFCGYQGWASMLDVQRFGDLPVPHGLKRAGHLALSAVGQGDSLRAEWLRRNLAGRPVFWGGAEAFTDAEKRRLLGPRLREQWRGRDSWEAIAPIHRRFTDAGGGDTLDWMTYLDLSFRLPELLLMRVDKMSMGVSLEGRVPFLDHEFVEFAMGVPSSLKRGHGELKHLLKRAVRPLLPRSVIDRPKQGFGVPMREWIRGGLGEVASKTLRRFCVDSDLLDPGEVERTLARGDASKIWYLLNVALWWNAYVGR